MATHSHHHHAHDIDFKSAFTVTKEPGSKVVITGEIPFVELEAERKPALKSLGENLSIDGFRKGHVPEAVLTKHVGEMAILAEMAERAIAHMYPHILDAHELDAIGQPQIEITKIAPGNPLGIKMTVAVLPEITLPDYKKIAAAINKDKASTEVTEEELQTQIDDILRRKVAFDRLQAKAKAKSEAAEDTPDLPTPETVATEEDPEKLPLPELTDELAASLGQPGQFSSVADFKAKLREHLTIEKTREEAAKHRAKITDAIIEASSFELPEVLVTSELDQMVAHMKDDLARANLNFTDYLNHIKKTEEDLRSEWRPAGEKRARLQLVLNEIAKKEAVVPDKAALDEQTNELVQRYPDADERRVRLYVASLLVNEAVLKELEAA